VRLFILTDSEGASGVVKFADYCRPESRYYETMRALVTRETNAAIEGALEAGVTDIYVADGHGPGALNVELLHPDARVLTGRPFTFPFGFDASCDLMFIIGQHAKSNTDGGHMSHTGSFEVEDMWINGVSVGEMGGWLVLAGQLGVPTPLVSGDQAACDEATALTPGVLTVTTKVGWKSGPAAGLTGEGNKAHNGGAVHTHPERVRQMIRETATRAVHERANVPLFRLDPPYDVVTLMRPDRGGEPHRVGRYQTSDANDFWNIRPDYVPLNEDLTTFIDRMNASARR
jgi:D-amino peptidase